MLEVFEHTVADDARERLEGDLAGHGEQLGGVVVGLVEATEALRDQILERGGRLHGPHEVPHAVVLGQGAGVPRGVDELAEHAGVAHGQLAETSQRTGHQRPAERPVEDRLDALLGERLDLEASEVPVLHQVVEGRGPSDRAHGQDGEHGARLHEGRHQRPRQVVELVAVVDQEQQALVAGLGSQGRPRPVEHPGAVELVGAAG